MIRRNLTTVNLNPIKIIFVHVLLADFVRQRSQSRHKVLQTTAEKHVVDKSFVMQLGLVPDKRAGSQLQINLTVSVYETLKWH